MKGARGDVRGSVMLDTLSLTAWCLGAGPLLGASIILLSHGGRRASQPAARTTTTATRQEWVLVLPILLVVDLDADFKEKGGVTKRLTSFLSVGEAFFVLMLSSPAR